MLKIVKYKIVDSHLSAENLSRSVNVNLERGWYLYGGVSVSKGKHSTVYIQAMVKYHQDDTPQVPDPRFENIPSGMFRI